MSSATDQTAAFFAAIRQSQLLAEDQLTELKGWIAQTHCDVACLAKEINRRRWLTPYQIKEIFKGRGKELILGPYQLVDLLGEGGMGKVFKAHHSRLGRDVAVKVIRKEKLKHPAAEARFHQEIRALAQMSHPNVITAFDADQVGDIHFYVMELVDGMDLTRMVKERGPLPVAEACEYIRQAALGLHHAFEMGLVHRDIKPSNLLVTRNGKMVKVVDLGLARIMDDPQGIEEAGRLTQIGFVIGTPDFLAPEQARNPGSVDIRGDIYSLGGTLYYLLSGKVPFDGANPTEKLLKHCTEAPPEIRSTRPEVPLAIEQIIQWCMAKAPEGRPQTPLQLALALQPFSVPQAPGRNSYPIPMPPLRHLPPQLATGVQNGPVITAPDDPASSSQLFKLPSQSTRADPIRRRAKASFPLGLLLFGLGGLLLVAILGFVIYKNSFPSLAPVETITNSFGMKMVRIEGGHFRMGSPPSEPGRQADEEGPAHDVTIRGPFLMAATEVTHGQYLKVTGTSSSRSGKRAANAADYPAENVQYDEAVEFCRKLTEKEKDQKYAQPGWVYRLPTEAEWEYACRAGTTTAYSFGDSIVSPQQARYRKQARSGPDDMPDKVGQREPNRWGLYDMHGNVAEWCLDWYKRGYAGDSPRDNPLGPSDGDRHVVRGGSFRDEAAACRSAARKGLSPTFRGGVNNAMDGTVGFRVVYAPAIKN